MISIGIVPARSGSKGVPGKNTAMVAGKPLIEWTLQTALVSHLTVVAVTTDSADCRAIAHRMDARRPPKSGPELIVVKRPPELATDHSLILDTVWHAVHEAMGEFGKPADAVMLLQPTNPLRTTWQINEALRMLEDRPNRMAVMSVIDAGDCHSSRLYQIGRDGSLFSPAGSEEFTRRQELIPQYKRDGTIYLARRFALREYGFRPPNTLPLILRREESVTIDDYYDMGIAEHLLTRRAKPAK